MSGNIPRARTKGVAQSAAKAEPVDSGVGLDRAYPFLNYPGPAQFTFR
jgi:hypothetical protein